MLKTYNVPTKNRFAQLDSDAESEGFETKSPKKATPAIPATPFVTGPSRDRQQQQQESIRPLQESRAPPRERGGARGGAGGLRSDRPFRGDRSGDRGGDRGGERLFRGGGGFRGGRGGGSRYPGASDQQLPADQDSDVLDPWEGRPDNRPMRQHGDRRFDRGGRTSVFRGREREFERRSGTGRGREMKKSGAGNHNWGTTEEEGGAGDAEVSPTDEFDETERPVVPDEGAVVEPWPTDEEKPKEENEEDKYVDLTEWQKTQKKKRALLYEENLAGGSSGPVRSVDAAELEKDGYHRYQKEESAEERAARELRMNPNLKMAESEDDADDRRSKTYTIQEFTGDFGRGGRGRGGRGGRGDRGNDSRRGGMQDRRPMLPIPATPVVFDLGDTSAFPSL